MKALVLLISLSLSVQLYAHREDSYYLQGTFGKKQVAIQIDEFGSSSIATFFYLKDKYDHFLEGRKDADSSFHLINSEWNETKTERRIIAELTVKETATNKWEGSFKNEAGKLFVVNLYPIVIDTLNHPFRKVLEQNDVSLYNALRTRDVRIKTKAREQWTDTLFVEKIVEKRSKLHWFRINSKNTSDEELDAINNVLQFQLFNFIHEHYSSISENEIKEFKLDYKVHALNSGIISYQIKTESTPYADIINKAVVNKNLDLKSGNSIMLEDIIWLANLPKPTLQKGEYAWFQYRYKEFGPKLLQLMQQFYSEEFELASEHSFNNVKSWQMPEWYLTPEGIDFKPTNTQKPGLFDDRYYLLSYRDLKVFLTDKYDFTNNYK